jgi:hypothetical protein
MDQLIAETVKGLSETLTQPSLMNLDVADLKAVVAQGGLAVMLWGEAKLADGPEAVVREALNHPLLDADHAGATGALVHITGGPDMTLEFAHQVATAVTSSLGPEAAVKWGARILPQFEGRARVMAIMTGIRAIRPAPPPVAALPGPEPVTVPDVVPEPETFTPQEEPLPDLPIELPAVPVAAVAEDIAEPEPELPDIELPPAPLDFAAVPGMPEAPAPDPAGDAAHAALAVPELAAPTLEDFVPMPHAQAETLTVTVARSAGPTYELPPKAMAAAPAPGPAQAYGIDFLS